MNKAILSLFVLMFSFTFSPSYSKGAQENKLEYCPTVDRVRTINISSERYMFDAYNADGKYFYSDIIVHVPGGMRSWPEMLVDSEYDALNKILKCRYYSYSTDATYFIMTGKI